MVRADYAPTRHPSSSGGVVAGVEPGSAAQRAGIRVGDRVLAVSREPIADILDWQWRTDAAEASVHVVRSGERLEFTVKRELDEPWGIEFASPIFDSVHTCRNDCAFCFMAQLPRGMRPALYLRDDDYRLSFLQGNFITLTNLMESDLARIAEQHLSPLYVSLHAVDPRVRADLVCAKHDSAVENLEVLLGADVDIHVQIVLVPGVNDADVLDQTLHWLAEREGILSVGVVPLGYTGHQSRFSASYERPQDASAVIAQIARWQQEYRSAYGTTWVHLADEFYLNAGVDVPTADSYDGFPLYENGIGLVRTFIDEVRSWGSGRPAATAQVDTSRKVLVTGTLFAPTLDSLCREVGLGVRVLAVENRFFGGNVAVSGLLTGADLAAAISADASPGGADDVYLIPDVVFNADGLTLDDMCVDEVRARAAAAVRVVSCDAAGLLDALVAPVEPQNRRPEE